MIIDELVAALGFKLEGEDNLKRFQEGIDRTQKQLETFASRVADIGRRVALGIAGFATAATAALYGAFRFATGEANQLSSLGDVATRLGVGVEQLQELRHAAEMKGMDTSSLDNSLRRFTRRAAEAAQGSGAAAGAFEELGIQLRNSDGSLKESTDLLGEVADALGGVENHADKLRLAFRMFDTDGAKLLPLLQEGREGMQALFNDGRERGLFFSQDQIDKARRYTEAMDLFRKSIASVRSTVALDMMPALTGLLDRWNDWFVLNQAVVRQRMSTVIDFGARALETFGDTAMRVAGSVEWLSAKIAELTGIGAGGQMATLGAGVVGWLAMRHPVLAALAAAFLALDDIRAYMEGDKSLIGDFLDHLSDVEKEIAAFREGPDAPITWLDQVIQALQNYDEALQRVIGAPPALAMPRIDWTVWSALEPTWREFEAWWDRLVTGFHNAGSRAGDALFDGLKSVGAAIRDWFAALFPDWASDWATSALAPAGAGSAYRTTPKDDRLPLGTPNPSRFDQGPAPVDHEELSERLQNFSGWMERMTPETTARHMSNTMNDNRDQSSHVEVNVGGVHVQQPTQAPAAVGAAVGRAAASAAGSVPLIARRITGNYQR